MFDDVVNRFLEKAYGAVPEQVRPDAEGLYTMRVLGRNMAYLLRCQEAVGNAFCLFKKVWHSCRKYCYKMGQAV